MEPWHRFAEGHPDAFESLFRQYQRDVYRWIIRIVRDPAAAEDLTVETFWRMYRARNRFNPDRIEYMLVRDEEKVFQLFLRGEIDCYLLNDSKKWYDKTEVPQVFNGYIEKTTFYTKVGDQICSVGYYKE